MPLVTVDDLATDPEQRAALRRFLIPLTPLESTTPCSDTQDRRTESPQIIDSQKLA